ncbi:HCL523Wp [Eremothecium sinecaudum]|uniref:Transcription initiation factor IIA large subunit n=1 Tax=Eremothecium sinecaudum TaxID=45286 RepID=A0A109UY67_9SACH|nr:HCL523Wp [Eremothecium sinecaudum]AMD19628.1 HCL523Wp [Eremothecium sinecaudum]
MSNIEAAKVYEEVVEDVINEVRQDFENAGIDEQTLQDLRRIWQLKLSESRVARFTWDPETIDQAHRGDRVKAPVGSLTQAHVSTDNSNGANSSNLQIPGMMIKEDSNDLSTMEQAASVNNGSQGQGDRDDTKELKQTMELTLDDPEGDIAEQLKQQAKQAKKSALLETDEINSDLDDSDDEYVNFGEEGDGKDVNIMLCLYEKVLRVKNKWKCNLKDGIATINNKDYAFQKSQGESEW